jgi:hypothetical protein
MIAPLRRIAHARAAGTTFHGKEPARRPPDRVQIAPLNHSSSKETAMSVRTIAEKYMELCGEGKHFEFMRNYYGPEMVSVEGDGREFAGKEKVIHKSEVFQDNNTIHTQDLRGPFFCGDADAGSGKFGVYAAIEFSPKGGGQRVRHEEVGLYTVNNDAVTREEFFYDGPFI